MADTYAFLRSDLAKGAAGRFSAGATAPRSRDNGRSLNDGFKEGEAVMSLLPDEPVVEDLWLLTVSSQLRLRVRGCSNELGCGCCGCG